MRNFNNLTNLPFPVVFSENELLGGLGCQLRLFAERVHLIDIGQVESNICKVSFLDLYTIDGKAGSLFALGKNVDVFLVYVAAEETEESGKFLIRESGSILESPCVVVCCETVGNGAYLHLVLVHLIFLRTTGKDANNEQYESRKWYFHIINFKILTKVVKKIWKINTFSLLLHKILIKMLKFISFGSGSSGNCYYFSAGSEGLLIDAGIGMRTLKKYLHDYNIKLDEIKNILVTHDHADHIKAVGVLSTDYNMPVYATKEVHNGIMRNYCVHKKIPSANTKVIEKNVRIKVGDLYITPFTVPHDSSDNVGYCIESDGIVFCLMTDVGHVTDEMKKYISMSDYLVLEANYDEEMLRVGNYPQYLKERIASDRGHLSNRDCGEALANNATERLKKVWLCHLSEENNHPVLAQKTVEQVLRSYGIVAGKDFQVEILKRKSASELFEIDGII